MNPVAQCTRRLKYQKLPPDSDVLAWLDGMEMFVTCGVAKHDRLQLIMPEIEARPQYLSPQLTAE